MLRYCQAGVVAGLNEDNVASVLSILQPASPLKKLERLDPPKQREGWPLHGDLDLVNCDRKGHIIRPPCLQAANDSLTHILQRLRLGGALRHASGNRRAFSDN